jgi:hypothetical protein
VIGVGVGDEAAGSLATGVEVEPGSADAELAGDQLDGGALHGEGVTGGAVAGPDDRGQGADVLSAETLEFRRGALVRVLLQGGCVPTLSRFFGIVIRMHFDEHAPPHFHALYGEFEAALRIEPLTVMEGHLPPRALEMVVEWGRLHAGALLENWEQAQARLPLDPIPPLD